MAIPNWLSLSQVSGSGDTIVTITADTYTGVIQRMASLLISGNTKSVGLSVYQTGQAIGATPDVINVDSAATRCSVTISATEDWYVYDYPNWVSVSVTAGTTGDTLMMVDIAANSTGNMRYGDLRFKLNSDPNTVYNLVRINQDIVENWDIVAHFYGDSFRAISNTSAITYFQNTIEVDGTLMSLTRNLNLETYGDHVVKYKTYIPGIVPKASFSSCTDMTSVEIMPTVYAVGEGCFNACTSLSAVTLHDGLESFGLGPVSMPGPSEAIYMFSGTQITEVTIPSTVNSSLNSVFVGMSALTAVTITNPHAEIAYNMFRFNQTGVTVNLPQDIVIEVNTVNGTLGATETVDHVVYCGPVVVGLDDRTLPTYNIREGTLAINGPAFSNCYNLTGMTIPNSLMFVSNYAFQNCSALTFENGVRYCGPIALNTTAAASGILTFREGTRIIAGQSFTQGNNDSPARYITDVVIPSSVESICAFPLSYATGVTHITIPSTVKYCHTSGFPSRLTGVTLNDTTWFWGGGTITQTQGAVIPYEPVCNTTTFFRGSTASTVNIPVGTKRIQDWAFYGMSHVTAITIPNTVEYIGERAFHGTSIQTLNIPSSVKSIGAYFVESCSALTSVTYSAPVSVRDFYDYSYGHALTNLIVPESVTHVGGYIGQGATVTGITLGNNVKMVNYDNRPFCFSSYTPNLQSVTIKTPVAPRLLDNKSFSGSTQNGVLHYPQGSDYSQWLSSSAYYLGYYNWTGVGDL